MSNMISDAQKRVFLCALREGKSVSAAARDAAGHRPHFYLQRTRDRAFADEWDAAVGRGDPPPGKLSAKQIDEFMIALRRCGDVREAAKITGIEIDKPVDLSNVSPEIRQRLREIILLQRAESDAPQSGSQRARAAFEGWLRSEPWTDRGVDLDELRRLSSRAADDYSRWRCLDADVEHCGFGDV